MARDKTDKTDKTPTATRALNEWGIPDWRYASAYGDVKRWTFDRWRWEFYRRRDDLREYFDTAAQHSYRALRSYSSRTKPHEPGFTALVTDSAAAHFGYSGLPNPRIGEQPPEVIRPADDYEWSKITDCNRQSIGEVLKINLAEDTQSKLLDAMMLSGFHRIPITFGGGPELDFEEFRDVTLSRLAQCRLVMLERGQVALTFEIDKPIEAQLKQAGHTLRKLQSEKHGKLIQKRRSPKKWLEYLRTLDAREERATWAEISHIYSFKKGTSQTARDTWNQARALCFNF